MNNLEKMMKRNQSPLLRHAIFTATSVTLLDVLQVTLKVEVNSGVCLALLNCRRNGAGVLLG